MQSTLEKYILPTLINDEVPLLLKDALIEYIFNMYIHYSREFKAKLSKQPLVPAFSKDLRLYKRPIDLVDGNEKPISLLYFDSEEAFVRPGFCEKNRDVLLMCGMKTKVTQEIAIERIKFYETCSGGSAVFDKARSLLIHFDGWFTSEADRDIAKASKWIPSHLAETLQLMSPVECRGKAHKVHVGYEMGILDIASSIGGGWSSTFGWDQPIAFDLLIRQLQKYTEARKYENVDSILSYIALHHKNHLPTLRGIRCIAGSDGKFYCPSQVFNSKKVAKYRMEPYFVAISSRFAKLHIFLMCELKIRAEPGLEDVRNLQKSWQQKHFSDNDAELVAAVEIVRFFADSHPRTSLNELLVPNTKGFLTKVSEIAVGDSSLNDWSELEIHFPHPSIPNSTISKLGIDSLENRNRYRLLGLENGIEYAPKEDILTVIRNSLDRYTMASTFSEYLANADDAGADSITWLIDECEDGDHQSDKLLTEELSSTQGPALFVHNTAVFQKKDFDGFREVGVGSKREDPEKIGMFGRGTLAPGRISQTKGSL
jgi:sacsin